MDWHTEEEDLGEEEVPLEEEAPPSKPEGQEAEAEEEKQDIPPEPLPEYKNYKTWSEIPEKERKNYGI